MRKEKQLLLDAISDEIKASSAFVVTSYEQIDANATAAFRSELVEAGGRFVGVKKRVFVKAAEECGIKIEDQLDGHIGLAFMGDNVVDATKKIYEFHKSNDEVFKILGGHFDGQMVSPKDVEQISKLPSRDEMRAQILGLLEAPMSQMLAVVEALLTAVPHCLENKAQKED